MGRFHPSLVGVDLFAGAGGLSLGASWAGIRVAVAVERDPHAVATYAHNHANTTVLCKDLRSVRSLPIGCGNDRLVFLGGPPCHGFSTSNQKTRSASNPSNWLFLEYLRLVRTLEPEWVVLENVKGLLETAGGLFFRQIVDGFRKLGYAVSHGVLNAGDFGVPQNRARLFLVGSRRGVEIHMPEPTVRKPTTVWEAISDLPKLENGARYGWLPCHRLHKSRYARLMRGNACDSSNHLVTKNSPRVVERFKHVPQGGNWTDIPAELMDNYADRTRCHTGIYRRLAADAPSVVITNYRKNMLIHPFEHRGLSVREAARLQSFPDWYEFKGPLGSQQQQVGDAVPPLLAKAVFGIITLYERRAAIACPASTPRGPKNAACKKD